MPTLELEDCINYLLTTVQHQVFQLMSAALAPYNITPGQYGVLNCLWTGRGDTPKDVAQVLNLETSTVSGLLDKMQKRGVIDRMTNTADRRGIQILLTPEGEALREPISAAIRDVNAQVLSDLSPEEAAGLLSGLRSLMSRLCCQLES